MNNPFLTAVLPDNPVILNGQRYYTIRQISEHINVCIGALHDRCNEGHLKFVIQPGLKNKKKLIPEHELLRFLNQ